MNWNSLGVVGLGVKGDPLVGGLYRGLVLDFGTDLVVKSFGVDVGRKRFRCLGLGVKGDVFRGGLVTLSGTRVDLGIEIVNLTAPVTV